MKAQYLRPADAAEYLSVSLRTIYRLMRSKKLKTYLLGGTRLVRISDIEAMIESSAQ